MLPPRPNPNPNPPKKNKSSSSLQSPFPFPQTMPILKTLFGFCLITSWIISCTCDVIIIQEDASAPSPATQEVLQTLKDNPNPTGEVIGISPEGAAKNHDADEKVLKEEEKEKKIADAENRPKPDAYEMLQKFKFPKGLLPSRVKNYVLHKDNSFVVNFDGECEFDAGGYSLFTKTNVTGKLSLGSVKELDGVSVKMFLIWFSITDLSNVGDGKLNFYIGPLSQSYPLTNFAASPQCRKFNAVDHINMGKSVPDAAVEPFFSRRSRRVEWPKAF